MFSTYHPVGNVLAPKALNLRSCERGSVGSVGEVGGGSWVEVRVGGWSWVEPETAERGNWSGVGAVGDLGSRWQRSCEQRT